jgi:hypothetical protein
MNLRLREGNNCHLPAGDGGGQFAHKGQGICHPTGHSKATPAANIRYLASASVEQKWQNDFGKTGVTLQALINAYATGLTNPNAPPSLQHPGTVKWDAEAGAYALTVSLGGAMVQRNITPGAHGNKPTVYHEALLLKGGTQGAGTGKRMMAETFRLYERLGVTEVTLKANIDIGSYAWARYGFDYDPHGATTDGAFQSGTLARANILADWGVLTAEQARDLAKAAVTPGGGIWKVADTKMKVPALSAKSVVDAFLNIKPPGSSAPIGHGLTAETVMRLKADAAEGIIPVGKLLLMDRYWSARFRMNNPAQRDRLRAYVGRDVFKD